jgi:diacylglycerol kinase (ATP)
MPSIKVIVNPLAGRGYAARVSPQIREALTALHADFDLVHTTAPGDATDLARQAMTDGFETVVAVGGDGTSHEVVNGLMASANGQPAGVMGCIPAGSGNDFAVMTGAPTHIARACAQIVAGHSRLVDLGQIRVDDQAWRYFDNTAGIGFDGLVTIEARRHRHARGMALYLPVVLKTIFTTMQPLRLTITADGATTRETAVMAVICNGPREGGSFIIAPSARYDDGLFDLNVTRWMGRLELLGMVPRFMKGTHVGDARVCSSVAREVEISSEDPLYLHVDGEIICGAAHRVQTHMVPAALRVITPNGQT